MGLSCKFSPKPIHCVTDWQRGGVDLCERSGFSAAATVPSEVRGARHRKPAKFKGKLSMQGWLVVWNIPIGSMYGIYANIWGILMVNVTIYSIHGSYGIFYFSSLVNNG